MIGGIDLDSLLSTINLTGTYKTKREDYREMKGIRYA